MRKMLKWTALILTLIFIGLQFTTPAHTNPPFDEAQTLQRVTVVPSDVSAMFARSCNDCHSNHELAVVHIRRARRLVHGRSRQ